jgi:TRAP-type C4-dicarboxylate transport system substrate-binding protein
LNDPIGTTGRDGAILRKGEIKMKANILITVLTVLVVASAPQLTPAANPTASITLKFETFYPPTHMLAEPLRQAPSVIQELTQGRVKVDTFFSSKLFPATRALISTSKGMADISHESVQYQCGDMPLCSLEGGTAFVNTYAAQKAMPELMKIFQKELDRMGFGVEIAYMFNMGPRCWTMVDKEVRLPSDIRGLKVKATAGIEVDVVKACGASPVSMTSPEMYEGMKKKIIDGGVIAASAVPAYKYYEVAKYASLIGTGECFNWCLVNRKSLSRLKPYDQVAVMLFLKHQGLLDAYNYWLNWPALISKISKGIKRPVYVATPKELAEWMKIEKPIIDKWVQEVGPAAAEAMAIVKKWNEAELALSPY